MAAPARKSDSTGFNSEFQAKPFLEKRDRKPRRVCGQSCVAEQEPAACDSWGAEEIRGRGEMLAEKALAVWKPLDADPAAVRQAELDEAIERAAQFSVDTVPCTDVARPLFGALAQFARDIGEEVVELPQARTVVYRCPEWSIELIPWRRRVAVGIAVQPDEVADISTEVTSSSEYEFITNSSVTGGSLFSVRRDADLPVAQILMRRAYERALIED